MEDRFAMTSASMELGKLNFGVVAVMAERGGEIAVEARQTVDALVEAGAEFDHVVLLGDRTYLSPFVTFGGAKITAWTFYEPATADGPWDLDSLRDLRDRLLERVIGWADEVRPEPPPRPREKTWLERHDEEHGTGSVPTFFSPPPPEPPGPKPFLKTEHGQCTWAW
jgi:hypothetical protein